MDIFDNINNSDDIFYRSEIMIGETILVEIMFWVVPTYVSLELKRTRIFLNDLYIRWYRGFGNLMQINNGWKWNEDN